MTEPTPQSEEIRDFTLPLKPHKFKIDDDVFAAPAILSPVVLQRLATLHAGIGNTDVTTAEGITRMLNVLSSMFKIFLPGAHGERFVARMSADGSDPETPPIDLLRHALPVLYYLLECYGMRPTQQSSPLLSASGTGDLTAGALAEALTGALSSPLSNF